MLQFFFNLVVTSFYVLSSFIKISFYMFELTKKDNNVSNIENGIKNSQGPNDFFLGDCVADRPTYPIYIYVCPSKSKDLYSMQTITSNYEKKSTTDASTFQTNCITVIPPTCPTFTEKNYRTYRIHERCRQSLLHLYYNMCHHATAHPLSSITAALQLV